MTIKTLAFPFALKSEPYVHNDDVILQIMHIFLHIVGRKSVTAYFQPSIIRVLCASVPCTFFFIHSLTFQFPPYGKVPRLSVYRNYRDTFDTVSVINNLAKSPTGVNVTVQHPGIKMSYRFFFLSLSFSRPNFATFS